MIKGRPISPHTKHVLKRISNRAGRAYLVVQQKITMQGERKQPARMYTTSEYKKRLLQDFVRTTKKLRELTSNEHAMVGCVQRF